MKGLMTIVAIMRALNVLWAFFRFGLTPSSARKPRSRWQAKRRAAAAVIRAMGFGILSSLATPCWAEEGFSDADIVTAKSSIRDVYLKMKGVTVAEIELIRKAPNELVGYVRLKLKKLEITKDCSALRDAKSGQAIWTCK